MKNLETATAIVQTLNASHFTEERCRRNIAKIAAAIVQDRSPAKGYIWCFGRSLRIAL